jgi:hypothetical protein
LPVIVERQMNTESQLQDLSPLARRRRIFTRQRHREGPLAHFMLFHLFFPRR